MNKPNSVDIVEWISTGTMKIRTSALDHAHPMHPYNQLLDKGLIPEEYGIKHPLSVDLEKLTRDQLISKIVDLRKELQTYMFGMY